MNIRGMRRGRILLAAGLAMAVSACGLPRSGPYYEDITGPARADDANYDLVEVTPAVVSSINNDESLGFDVNLTGALPEKTAIFGVGDVLSVTIWERGENGVYSALGGATTITAEIEESGRIYIPYVGNVRAAGRTADGLRRHLRAILSQQTLDPQVEVRSESGDSRSITITGTAGVSTVVPIERTTRSLLGMLANTGFAVEDPETVRVIIRRGEVEGSIWLQELYENPQFDVPVRAGDVIFLNTDTRTFRSFGAASQARVPFPTRDISVLDALSLIGGLNPARSDPSGVFIFRVEPPEIAVQVSERAPVDQPRNVVYLLDLSDGDGFFLADTMKMKDGDILYVTDAPFTRFQIVAGSIASVIGFAGSTASAATLAP